MKNVDQQFRTKKESMAKFDLVDVFNPARVLDLFKEMTDEDCQLLYLADRPEKFIITNIAIPPIAIRPSVIVDRGMSNENDITERLKKIYQFDYQLREVLEGTNFYSSNLQTKWDILQVEVAQYINSDVRGVPFSMQSSKPLSGFIQRLKGKQGRFRGNLSGKRVEFTGRTVISPDPNLKITEVAIPIHMARLLTYPERVSCHNIEKLRECVLNGPNEYPGAKLVRYPDGTSRYLGGDYRKRVADLLQPGCVVDRHLENGDVVLFNRQPSLHRMSIMCHRARIMPWRTLRFNESVCNPYNADFDGDEMNMHVPQTEEARTEALTLMGVQNNLCTPKNGEILVASTQDFLTSSFLITRKDTFYDRAAFSLMCSYMDDGMDLIDLPTPAILKPVELWTGKQLFSVLLRPNANMRVYLNCIVKEKNYSRKTNRIGDEEREVETMCSNDGFVYFRNSEHICGQLGKATLGNGNKDGLYSVLLRDYNAHGAATCMNRLAKLSARWIGNHGFSIGIDDVQPKQNLIDEKAKIITGDYSKCDDLIQKFNEGKLVRKTGCDAAQTLEVSITEILNQIRDKAGKACTNALHWRNSPLIMSQCGSKGSVINISQMIACVGQQSVGGRRAPNGFIDRSLPHFPKNSKTPAAKGFVANSFYSGLRPTEFFFHTMAGREGLTDTAVKTADTGYMSRRLMKSLEDLSVQYDNTVRTASGCIVQFIYGDDGMDPAYMEGKNGFPLNFNRLFMHVKATCPFRGQKYLSPQEILTFAEEQLNKLDAAKICSDAFIKSLLRFLEKEKEKLKMKLEKFSGENKSEIVEYIGHKVSGITEKQLEVFVRVCLSRYRSKVIEPGTTIGAIGAQSIGEPGTQMTLKTFHFAGVASMNITQGVPRIKEIINAAKKISTPIITAQLEDPQNVYKARVAKGHIEKTLLQQVSRKIKYEKTAREAAIYVSLDMEKIREAELGINGYTVKESMVKSKFKIKAENIDVLKGGRKLKVRPDNSTGKVHYNLIRLCNQLPLVVVKGILTAERAVISEKKSGNKYKEFQMFVEGKGLKNVMATDGIDGRNTTSNDIMELLPVLGIEAARTAIINETKEVMESHGMNIDIRHMMLLADCMAFKGEVLGINRYGIQKMGKSVLMLASFERTSDHLFSASAHGKVDEIEGVSECIIMGIPMRMGTGMIKVMQRVDVPPLLNYGPDPIIS